MFLKAQRNDIVLPTEVSDHKMPQCVDVMDKQRTLSLNLEDLLNTIYRYFYINIFLCTACMYVHNSLMQHFSFLSVMFLRHHTFV